MSLLLFYSVNCGHCRMLLDSVNRHDKNKMVKLACIESLISENRLPPQIHSVPAMMVILEKKFLYGKNVFDYLLLPGTGKLVQQGGGQENDAFRNVANNNAIAPNKPANTSEADEPLGFSISLNGMSDRFSLIDDETADEFGNNDRQYNWASLSTTDTPPQTDPAYLTVNADVRTKKELPSLADLQELRALDMVKPDSMNPSNMPVATSSR
jgi:hypothetical protein